MSKNGERYSTGIERRFDLKCQMDAGWFRKLVEILLKNDDPQQGFPECHVRRASYHESKVRFRSVSDWATFIYDYWDEVTESYFWSNRGPVQTVLCDHSRQQLTLCLVAETLESVEGFFRDISEDLDLKPLITEPYRYRQSSLEFEVGNWRPDLFAVGVKRISSLMGSNPAIREAYAKTFEGDVERLSPFFSLGDFLAFVSKRASRFGEAVVGMQGRGTAIGISVTSDHKKLRIRTSVRPEELDEIIGAWPDELKLKPMKAVDSGAGVTASAPAPTENPWMKYGTQVVIAVITVISGAGLIGLHKAIWPDYAVVITAPSLPKGETFAAGEIPLDWYMKPEQTSFRSDRRGEAAAIIVYGKGGIVKRLDGKPPTSIALSSGEFTIEISATDARPSSVEVSVVGPTH